MNAAQQIDRSYFRAEVLTEIAETYGQLENSPQATESLDKAFTAAQQIDDSYSRARVFDRARVLKAIAETYGQLENFFQAKKYLDKAFTAAQQIDNSNLRASVLTAITQTQVKFSYWRQAYNTVFKCTTDECKVESLAHILTGWAEKKNPALVDKKED